MTKANGAKYWDATLNFMTGCTKVSPGCDNCWARSAHEARRKALLDPTNKFVNEMYRKPFSEIQLFHDKLSKPIPSGKPKTYFVNNTGDLFHPDVPYNFIHSMFRQMIYKKQHRYLVLTKRPEHMSQTIKLSPYLSKHIWLGLTICNQREADENVIHLLRTPAVNRWLSLEPMLSEIDLKSIQYQGDTNYFLNPLIRRYSTQPQVGECNSSPFMSGLSNFGGLDWIVIGCESGKNRRPCKLDWVYSIVDQCQNAGVKCFVKQLDLDGKCEHDIERFPRDLQVRDLPWEPTSD